ncbi:MAG: hypothetical protein JW945_00710, partial [Methanomicrobia archaeon]|nr:hypothetical protein [Methanomicrobia archaeon]
MEQNRSAWKIFAGVFLVILVVSVLSGAISASDNRSIVLNGVEDAGFTAELGAAEVAQVAKSPHAALSQAPPLGSYSHNSDLLQITVGEQSSSGWNFQYDPVNDPGNFIRSVYSE